MLVQISKLLWINLDDIYLVNEDEFNGELLVYIKMHPKHAIILKDKELINRFIDLLSNHMIRKQNLIRISDYETAGSTSENEPQTS